MRNTLVIAWRELEERRFVLLAAVAFALLPLVLAAIPGISYGSPREAIMVGSMLLSLGFTLVLALILGASIVGRDLSEGRMSFYFSRPIAATSIWAGKVLAALILIALSFFLIEAPARFLGTGTWDQFWQIAQVVEAPVFGIEGSASIVLGTAIEAPARFLGTGTGDQFWQIAQVVAAPVFGIEGSASIVLGTALVLFFVAHVLGTFVRSRSPLIALDFVAAVACGVVISFLFRPLRAGMAGQLTNALSIGFESALMIALVCAGAWQIAHGRTDRKRNHYALSQFLWSAMAIALLLGAAFVAWVVSARPGDLSAQVRGQRAPAGPWLTLTGRAARRGDYRAGFLVNSETGVFTRFDLFGIQSMRFSPDGQRAFFLKAGAPASHPVGTASGEADLYTLRLGDAKPSNTGIVLKTGWFLIRGTKVPTGHFFISGDGSRIATAENGTLSVYDVARKQSLGSVLIGSAYDLRVSFLPSDVVRMYVTDNRRLRILEFNVRTKSLHILGGVSPEALHATSDNVQDVPPQPLLRFNLDSTLTRMVVRYRAGLMALCDARTGATIRTLVDDRHAWNVRFLRDGRIAIIRVSPVASALMLFSSDGVPQREIALGPIKDGLVVADDGSRAVALVARSAKDESLLSIDLHSGMVERRQGGIGIVVRDNALYAGGPLPAASAEPREVIYIDAQNHLMAWNPATGATRAVIRG